MDTALARAICHKYFLEIIPLSSALPAQITLGPGRGENPSAGLLRRHARMTTTYMGLQVVARALCNQSHGTSVLNELAGMLIAGGGKNFRTLRNMLILAVF
jgi:hypothetical protein